eukprot:TRINITY_DN19853_c0_g1_i1.p1 TRINITY_DN19853_c0_g1~~TRINITY_DN19853_c0_g1_i1.p1  ORF type:complete len:433 (+),score=164.14 TRINITY_DN19853_c0_g1_i1:43-1299(+)
MVNNSRLYTVLGVATGATEQEIKRGYYDKAQRYHPDRKTAESNEAKFKEVQGAYEILKDPEKKKIYDRYGEEGLRILNQGGDNVAQLFVQEPFVLICIVCTLLLPVFLFILFLTLRIDETITWKWAVVFIPVWLLDACLILVGLASCCASSTDENGDPVRTTWLQAFLNIVPIAAFIAFTIMLTMRLDDVHSYSWPVVFIPVYVLLVMKLQSILVGGKLSQTYFDDQCRAALGLEPTREMYLQYVVDTVLREVRDVVFILILVLRLHESITWSWFAVGIPQYVVTFIDICVGLYLQRKEGKCDLLLGVIKRLLPLGQLLLILGKADGGDYSFAVAMIPIWLLLGLTCCFPCGMIVMGAAQYGPQGDDADSSSETPGERTPVQPNSIVPGDKPSPTNNEADPVVVVHTPQPTSHVEDID